VSSLNFNGNVVYAATLDGCGGNANALYAVDLESQDRKVAVFPTNGSGLAGMAGTAVGTDGTVYAQIPDGHGDQSGAYHDTVVALDPKDLKVKDYFTPSGEAAGKDTQAAGITPLVFSSKGKDLIVAGGRDGRVYLLDSTSLGGRDHHKPLSATEPIASADANHAGYGFRGTFASWEDADSGARWVYAPMAGPQNASAKFSMTNGSAPTGSVVALKMDAQNGQPALTPEWISQDMVLPAPVVTTNGLVFALSSGEPEGKTHATLYALDGATGKELYSSGDAVASYSHDSGLAVANNRVYFTTHDNAVYCFGFPKLEPQLTER
jgi:outer membrane protein assembly factor BamB